MKTQTQQPEQVTSFINCCLERETEKAIKVCNSTRPYGEWFPKSYVRIEKIQGNDEQVKVFAPVWMIQSKGFKAITETSKGLYEHE